MTGIDRPSGPGGAGGPGGPSSTDAAAADGPDGAGAADAGAAASGPSGSGDVGHLAADLDAGRIGPEDAIAQLVEGGLGGLDPADQAELRALLGDLIAADPYLADLARELGATPPDPDLGHE